LQLSLSIENGVEVQIAANCGDGQVSARVLAIHEVRDGHVRDVPVSELVDGDNTVDIATVGVPVHGYLSTIANVDLILDTP
jgi:hypothetical protein